MNGIEGGGPAATTDLFVSRHNRAWRQGVSKQEPDKPEDQAMTDKSVLCVHLGTSSLKWARFAVDDTTSPVLTDYGISPVHDSGTADVDLGSRAAESLRRLLADDCPGASHCCLCASASHLFTRFLRFPAMDQTRLRQVLEFELKEHFPVPLDALTWDHQVLEPQGTSQVDTLLTAVKSATAERWLKAAESAGRRVDVLDAGPAALANAFLYNYGELPGCSLLLDIGSRTTTAFLFEDGKFFFRTVNLGGNAITFEFSKETGLPPEEAEQRKIRDGMVGLAGECERAGNGTESVLARVAREFMARLCGHVRQTVHFYRSQRGGSPPERVFLAGGGSLLPFTAEYFEEKLQVPVESFNPLRRIRTDPAIDRADLAGMAPALGCAVGVALRAPMRCPIELNLIPASVFRRRTLRRSSVYVAAAAAAAVAAFCIAGLFYEQLAAEQRQTRHAVSRLSERLSARRHAFETALTQRNSTARAAEQLALLMTHRFYWADLLTDLRRALETTESVTSNGGIRTGIWIEAMRPDLPEEPALEETAPRPSFDPRLWKRYFGKLPELSPNWESVAGQGAPDRIGPAQSASGPDARATNRVSTVQLTCRAVSWNRVSPTADTELAYAFLKQLQASPFLAVGTNGTRLTGRMRRDDATGTFSFDAKLVLKDPIQL